MESAASIFGEAVTRGSQYALPHASLADVYYICASFVDQNPAEMPLRSKGEDRRALQLEKEERIEKPPPDILLGLTALGLRPRRTAPLHQLKTAIENRDPV